MATHKNSKQVFSYKVETFKTPWSTFCLGIEFSDIKKVEKRKRKPAEKKNQDCYFEEKIKD